MKIAELCSVLRKVDPRSTHGIYNHVANLCGSLSSKGHAVSLFAAGDAEVKSKVYSRAATHALGRGLAEIGRASCRERV